MELGSEGVCPILELLAGSLGSNYSVKLIDSVVLVCSVGQPCQNRLGKFPWCQAKGSMWGLPPKSSGSPKASGIPQRLSQPGGLVSTDGRWDTPANKGQQQGRGGSCCPVAARGEQVNQATFLPLVDGRAPHRR